MLGIKEMGKHQDIPSKFFCLIVPNISWGNPFLQCFRNFLEGKNVMDKGGDQEFASENFSLTDLKKFAGESFTVSLISGIEKC